VVGADLGGLVWTVAAPVRLLGRLVDAAGRGLPSRKVVAEAVGPLDAAGPSARASESPSEATGEDDGEASAGEGVSDECGEFAIAGLRAGHRYRVELGDDPSVAATVALRADGTSDAVVLKTNAAGTLRVHVTRAGAPARGTVLVHVRGPLGTRTAQAEQAGTFVLKNVAPARYAVSAQDGRNPPVSRDVELRAGATVEVVLDLPELSASMTGLVLDALGAPVRDAWVKALTREGPGMPADSALTAADGTFTLDTLDPSARYDLEVSRTTDPTDSERTVRSAAQPGRHVVVRLP
jgi:hypothetical protein